MFQLEVLRARHGDALMLHFGTAKSPKLAMIDGGPGPVYAETLKKRIAQLRAERGLDDGKPLDIDLLMISHIDDDHVGGVVRLASSLKELDDDGEPMPCRIKAAWHNAFDDILGNSKAAVTGASIAAALGNAVSNTLVLASVEQGRTLRDLFRALGVKVNPKGKKGLIQGGMKATLGNLSLTAVAPSAENLQALQEDWDKKLPAILKKKGPKEASLELAAYVDQSVYNLSSIVVLVEAEGKRILLTGDARGDHTLEGLRKLGLLKRKPFRVDVLKLPHHGSIRDVDLDYFKSIQAKHYVISADGKFENPDIDTLKLISAARDDDDFTIHLTYPMDEFTYPAIGKKVQKFFAAERKKGRKYDVQVRDPDALSFTIDLG